MKLYTTYISPEQAREAALNEAGVKKADFTNESLERTAGQPVYELDYTTDYMEYCCYVDAETSEVVGFDAHPTAA